MMLGLPVTLTVMVGTPHGTDAWTALGAPLTDALQAPDLPPDPGQPPTGPEAADTGRGPGSSSETPGSKVV